MTESAPRQPVAAAPRWSTHHARAQAARVLRHYLLDNPVLVLEFRRIMRNKRMPALCVTVILLTFIVCAIPIYTSGYLPVSPAVTVSELLLPAIFTAELLGLMLFAPTFAAYAIPRERELQIDGDLRCSSLTAGERVAGRLAAVLILVFMLLLLPLPFFCIGFLVGGISPAYLIAGHVLLFTIGALGAAAGLLVGSEAPRTTSAQAGGFVITLLCLLPVLVFIVPFLGDCATSPSVGYALSVVCGLMAALLLVVAREQLADWPDRGRVLRPFILAILMLLPVLMHLYGSNWWSAGSFSRSDLRATHALVITAHFIAIFLLGAQAPRPEQVRLPLAQAWREAWREPFRENPLSALPLLFVSLVIFNLIFCFWTLLAFTKDLPSAIGISFVSLVVLTAYAGVGALITFHMRTRFFMAGSFPIAMFAILLAPALLLIVTRMSVAGKPIFLMPVLFIFDRGTTSTFFQNSVWCIIMHLVVAWFAWHMYSTLWRLWFISGDYSLRSVDPRG